MKETSKTIIILGGANGSGKSTLANVLLQEYSVEFLNADVIASELSINHSPEIAQRLAGREYIKRRNWLFQQDKSFILEMTLSGRVILKTMADAKKHAYRIILVYCFLPNSLACIRRVKKRVANGGHDVREEDITRRYFRSITNFWNEGRFLVDQWLLFYNGFDYQPIKIAHGHRDVPIVQDITLYHNFYTLSKRQRRNEMLSMDEQAVLFSEMFTRAAAIAKEHDKIQPECNITEEMMTGYLLKAFPKMSPERAKELAKEMFDESAYDQH